MQRLIGWNNTLSITYHSTAKSQNALTLSFKGVLLSIVSRVMPPTSVGGAVFLLSQGRVNVYKVIRNVCLLRHVNSATWACCQSRGDLIIINLHELICMLVAFLSRTAQRACLNRQLAHFRSTNQCTGIEFCHFNDKFETASQPM